MNSTVSRTVDERHRAEKRVRLGENREVPASQANRSLLALLPLMYDTVIIGAGMSGLAGDRLLHDRGSASWNGIRRLAAHPRSIGCVVAITTLAPRADELHAEGHEDGPRRLLGQLRSAGTTLDFAAAWLRDCFPACDCDSTEPETRRGAARESSGR
jgi:hypothetical protein